MSTSIEFHTYDKHELESLDADVDDVVVFFFDGELDQDCDSSSTLFLPHGDELIAALKNILIDHHSDEEDLDTQLSALGEVDADTGFLITKNTFSKLVAELRMELSAINDQEELREQRNVVEELESFLVDTDWDNEVVYAVT